MSALPLASITIHTDGGPWVDHDMPCAVCQVHHAVYNLNVGRFEPCWSCQDDGWVTTRVRSRRLRRWLWERSQRWRAPVQVASSSRGPRA